MPFTFINVSKVRPGVFWGSSSSHFGIFNFIEWQRCLGYTRIVIAWRPRRRPGEHRRH